MATKKSAPRPTVDNPKGISEVTLDGQTYKLDFGLQALADAETAFNREGKGVNLLFSLDIYSLNLSRLRDLFACAARTHHPELSYDAAVALVRVDNLYDVARVAISVLQPAVV